MTKKKKSKTTTKTKPLSRRAQYQQVPEQRSRKPLTILKKMIWSFLSVMTIGGFLFTAYPRLSVSPGESLDRYKPFSTPFIIKNDGYLPLLNVNYSVTINNMEDINYNRFTNASMSGIAENIPKLSPNKSTTIFINKIVDAPPKFIKYAEIHINLSYKPYLIPYTFTENVRFKTEIKTNDEYLWLQYHSD